MLKRKRRTDEEIKQEIMAHIEKLDFPTTTENIAQSCRLNWYAATNFLNQMKAEGRLFHKRVGKQNQWWVEEVGKQKDKIRNLEKERDKFKEKAEHYEEKSYELERYIKELEGKLKEKS